MNSGKTTFLNSALFFLTKLAITYFYRFSHWDIEKRERLSRRIVFMRIAVCYENVYDGFVSF